MITSILTSIKKLLGIDETYDAFDQDIIMHINTVFMSLNQFGVGPTKVFSIQNSDATWADFLGEESDFESVKTYIYMRVRLMFDPPSHSFVISSIENQIKELEWRFIVQAEDTKSDE